MKGRKLLSAIIAGAMVLGTISLPTFAEGDTVAKIGATEFTDLQTAVNTANAIAGTERVTIEITAPGVYDPITITRANVTVQGIVGDTAEESTVIKTTDNTVSVIQAENITFKNLYIDNSGFTADKNNFAIDFMKSGDKYNFTADGCYFLGNGEGIALYYHTAKATIINCTFENFERGYYGCGDNNAMEMLTITGNTFNNVKVPVDGYWGRVYTGSEDYNIVITGNTFNPGTWETSYIQLWDYVQYGHYMGWNNCNEGSAIKAKIAGNIYNGNTIFYPTHCNVNTVTKIDIDAADKASLTVTPRCFVALPDEVTGADVTYADGSTVDLWNTTMYKTSGSKKVLYTVPAGEFTVTLRKGSLSADETIAVEAPAEGMVFGENLPTVTLSEGALKAAKINTIYYDSISEAVEAAQDGDTITLLSNEVLDAALDIVTKCTIDLNGKTIKGYSQADDGCIRIYAPVVFKDSIGGGAVIGDGVRSFKPIFKLYGPGWPFGPNYESMDCNGNLTIESGKYEMKNGEGRNSIVWARDKAAVTVNGGELINGNTESYSYGIFAQDDGATVILNGGMISTLSGYGYGVYLQDGAEIIMENASIKTSGDCAYGISNDGKVTIKSGSIMAEGSRAKALYIDGNAETVISGGIFSSDVSDYVAKGCYQTANEDGTYTVKQTPATVIDTAKTTGATVTLDDLDKHDKVNVMDDATYKVVVDTAPTEEAAKANAAIAANGDTNTDKTIFNISVVKIASNGVTTDLGGTAGVTDQQVTLTLGDTPAIGSTVYVYHVKDDGTVEQVAAISADGTNKITFIAPSFSTYAVTYTAAPAVESTITGTVGVVFSPVSEGSNQYYITLKALEAGKKINRFMSADLAFVNNCAAVDYEIEAAANMNVAVINENGTTREYRFDMDGLGASCATGEDITIGTITFSGYGTLDFSVNGTYTAGHAVNIVNTAKAANNIVDNYMVSGGTLLVNDDVTGNPQLAADEKGTITDTLSPIKKNLTVNVTFNNTITDNEKAYQDMKAVISGGDLLSDITVNFGTDETALVGDTYTFTQALTQNVAYTVTISGAGYRTARHTVTMTTDKTLNFWNNVKDTAEEIETGKGAKKANFLAGDIVKDNNINIYDLSAVVSYFGTDNLVSEHPDYAKYDLNRDGKIDSKDVAYVLVSWGN